ncbi:MAG TPA: YHS domain protein [Flavobacteriales bacterium]|nr:YHS domain protein [Flavobacteriales bacterium]|tara:strand:+ start:2041 stop:2493 length:453 start_codon:yes stop_codon:yes gene_type:complete
MKKLYILFFLFFSISTYSQNDNIHLNLNKKNIAIDGYDLVSYFKLNDSKTGKKEFKYTYQAAHYFFSSESHMQSFKINPKKYLPKFGGWCAFSMAKDGKKERVDPKSFLIIDGELYLFYEYYFKDKREKWLESKSDLTKQAEQNWKKITN